jgi:predicted site-specific integrase-resolvase
LLRYIEEGRLPARQLPTGHYRIRRVDLERLLGEEPGRRGTARLRLEAITPTI